MGPGYLFSTFTTVQVGFSRLTFSAASFWSAASTSMVVTAPLLVLRVNVDGGGPADGGGHEDRAVRDAIAEASSCPTVGTYCATDGSAGIRDWATAKTLSTWCTAGTDATNPVPLRSSDIAIYAFSGCNGHDTVVWENQDATITYFYDESSGSLTGIGTGPADPSNGTTWSPTCLGGAVGLTGAATFSLSGSADGGYPFPLCQFCETCSGGG